MRDYSSGIAATQLYATPQFDIQCTHLDTWQHSALVQALDAFACDVRTDLVHLEQCRGDPTLRLYKMRLLREVTPLEILVARVGDVWIVGELGGTSGPIDVSNLRFAVNLNSGRVGFVERHDLLYDFGEALGPTDWTNVDLVKAGVDPAVASSLMCPGSTVHRSLDPRLDTNLNRALDLLEVDQATFRARRGGRATKAEIVELLESGTTDLRRLRSGRDLVASDATPSTQRKATESLLTETASTSADGPASNRVTRPEVAARVTPEPIDSALLRRFEAEHARRGRLDADMVASICERRGLDAAQVSALRAELEAGGLLPKQKSAVVEGWTPPDDDRDEYYTPDLMGLYLAEVGAHQLLLPEDEVTLGRRIRTARELIARKTGREHSELREFLRTQRSLPDLADHERRIVQEGADAEERMFVCNLRLVVSVARKVAWNHPRLEPLDFVQAGNMGLSRAIQRFDHRLGYKFSTYATWWIKQAINRELANHGRLIRLPVHVEDRLRQLYGARRNLQIDLGREPSLSELAQFVGNDVGTVQAMLDYGQMVASLDKPLGDGRETTLGDLLEDGESSTAFDQASRTALISVVVDVLHELSEREQEVIRLRFGLDDGRQRTLEEVGRHVGVTRERIRQIEAKTLGKLREPSRASRLKDFLV